MDEFRSYKSTTDDSYIEFLSVVGRHGERSMEFLEDSIHTFLAKY